VSHPTPVDAELLARLMLDAYLGTIDYEGETIVEARDEVARYFAGTPLLEHSWLHVVDGPPVSVCLVSHWGERGCPIVSYVMTAPDWKSRGLATELLEQSLASLAETGPTELRAVITEGNLPSEAVFRRAGFRRV
jgi:RimJ/RimL family protein N-acetyltransferase